MAGDGDSLQHQEEEPTVLAGPLGGGPKGLGDPDDKSLRKVEKEVLIPQKMKLKARKYKCHDIVKTFGECAKAQGLLMPFMCRKEAKELENCLKSTYADEAFVKMCETEYLEERSEYRRTGVKMKEKKLQA